jgi:hypothetical protein
MVPESTLEELESACSAAQLCLMYLSVVKMEVESQSGDVEPALMAEAIREPARELLESWRALYVALNPHVQRDFMEACKEPVQIGEIVIAESVHSAVFWVSHQAILQLSFLLMPAGYWPSSEDPKTDCFLVDLRSETPVDAHENAVGALRTIFGQWSFNELRKYTLSVYFECKAARSQLPPAGKGEDVEPRNLNENSLKPTQDQEVIDLLGNKVATPDTKLPIPVDFQQTPYQKLWDYAQKMWTSGTDKFKICEHISNGPGKYSNCLDHLIPNVGRSDQTKRFHSVASVLNKEIKITLGLEVYRLGEQVLIREAAPKPTTKSKHNANTKKSATKRKR